MRREDILAKVAEAIEVENLAEDMVLKDLEEWDSMALLMVAALADGHFAKQLPPDIKFSTAGEIVDYLLGE